MTSRRRLIRLIAGALLLASAPLQAQSSADEFDHWAHRRLFPSCVSCHPGAAAATQPLWPSAEGCAACHDGAVEKSVRWAPPTGRPTLLRFTHLEHAQAVARRSGIDSSLRCVDCHATEGAPWMQVSRSELGRCFDCHGVRTAHFDAPDSACATCHRTLPEMAGLPRERIATFPSPASHHGEGFSNGGHGKLARSMEAGARGLAVAPSCATCHAQEFCLQCHVNGPETPAIQALGRDERSLAIHATLEAPTGHADDRFLARHGGQSRARGAICATCHTQESCIACHRANPAVAARLPVSSTARGVGARIVRNRPASHSGGWAVGHGSVASASSGSCAGCHARSECLECHRPNPGNNGTYHRAGFLASHPSAAYNRQSDCSECHNPGSFCTSCHVRSGLSSSQGLLQGQYHDVGGTFLLSHGAAARRGLESCVTCHTETDCVACHSAQTRRFNPHGPGFDPDRLRRKNPQTCAACHGQAIPGGN